MNHLKYSSTPLLPFLIAGSLSFRSRFRPVAGTASFPPHYTGNICISVYRLNIHEGFRCRVDSRGRYRQSLTRVSLPLLPFYALHSSLFFLLLLLPSFSHPRARPCTYNWLSRLPHPSGTDFENS